MGLEMRLTVALKESQYSHQHVTVALLTFMLAGLQTMVVHVTPLWVMESVLTTLGLQDLI